MSPPIDAELESISSADGESASSPSQGTNAIPDGWIQLWGRADETPVPMKWHKLKRATHELASGLELAKLPGSFAAAVGSEHLRERPIHRWFTYKEGFSPSLLGLVIEHLKLEGPLRVIDPFGGVATTAMAGLTNPAVTEVRSVEYSPFARFVGETKLLWPNFDPDDLEALLPTMLAYDRHREVSIPKLSTFSNPEIFSSSRIRTLLAAREHLLEVEKIDQPERDFFLLGLAAILEDLSGAMKDGRALRIKGGRSRRASSLGSSEPLIASEGAVKRALAGQWSAMISDLRACDDEARALALRTSTHHLSGDARKLDTIELYEGGEAFPAGWANLSLFSPPYLNCIDYTELYKLELWFMGHIRDHASFRRARLGTLRSHPSVRFAERNYFNEAEGPVITLVEGLAEWVREEGLRPENGPIILQYFEDMLEVWRQQYRVLAHGATAVCVVANSTFSRREKCDDGSRGERWRLPILTDVILGELALLAGFDSVELLHARDLRPRNVKAGSARESLVVARKI